MIRLWLSEKGANAQPFEFEKDDLTVGRTDDNDIVLARSNVSKKHTRLVQKEGKIIVADLKSTNGTFVNGKRLMAPQVMGNNDQVAVGDFIITIADPAFMAAQPAESATVAPSNSPTRLPQQSIPSMPHVGGPSSAAPANTAHQQAPVVKQKEMVAPNKGPPISPEKLRWSKLLKLCHDRLIESMDLRRLDMDRLGDEELWKRTEQTIRTNVQKMEQLREMPQGIDKEKLIKDVLNEALGLGPLEDFLSQDDIGEIMVNHANQIYIERKGKLMLSDTTFSSNEAVRNVIERIVAPIGRRIDESTPLVDARLKDGSRVNAVIPPLALKGPCITIRKFKKDRLRAPDLVKFGTVTGAMAEFLDSCVKAHKNMVISGGTGSGKTTLLNIVSSFIQHDERIVTVEDAAELQLSQEHWIQLESRPPNIEGKGAISIRDLVKNCLRMRPDRIIIGECRGGETLDMLQAMNTGHDGSLTTLHANTPRDALARMETMVMMSGMDLPLKAIREQIANAVHLIVQQTRFSDGSRKVTYITEVSGMEGDIITLQDIFYFKQDGFDEKGKVRGRFIATGFVPKFYEDLQRRGIAVNMDIFRED